MNQNYHFAVLGAGSWGTALACLLADNGLPVVLWGRNSERMAALQATRCNTAYFKEAYTLPDNLLCTSELEVALQQSNTLLIATPCRVFADILEKCRGFLVENPRLVWACKGLNPENGGLLQTLVVETLSQDCAQALISGPNFSHEVMAKLPTATTVAAEQIAFATDIAACLHNDWFRAYSIDDMISAQLGGALKNVYAIAAGISDGLGFGANARAALLTRAMVELMRLGSLLGGRTETFMGMTGMGDLILTCTDDQSRNRRFGLLLAKKMAVNDALATIGQAVEGLKTTELAYKLAEQHKVDMPILCQVYRVIYQACDPLTAVKELLGRELRVE